MNTAAKILRILASVYLIAAGLFIGASYVAILWFEGWWKLTEILSPFNIVNWLVTAVTLSPGFALLILSERISAKT
jgi:hypothetical protein